MKFQWYVIDLEEGTVKGTNDVEVVQKGGFLENDAYVILTAQHGMYYLGSTKENQVEELTVDNPDHNDDPAAEED